jgi:hypothetical protein
MGQLGADVPAICADMVRRSMLTKSAYALNGNRKVPIHELARVMLLGNCGG